MTRFFSEQNHAQQARSGWRPPHAASVQSSASAWDLYFTLSPHLCSELRFLLFGRHQALQLGFIRLTQLRHLPCPVTDLPKSYLRMCGGPAPTPTSGSRGLFRFHVFFLVAGGCCRMTASGLLIDLEPSGATWRLSGG